MQRVDPQRFTFADLSGQDSDRFPSLCYLVGLVDSATHKITEVIPAGRILSSLYECEEQCSNAGQLKVAEEFFKRYFPGGYHPQTPCMLAEMWSPITAMLDRGLEPVSLNRDYSTSIKAVASGIWKPKKIANSGRIESAKTVEDLFWAIIGEVTTRAIDRKMWINIIAQPGWSYDAAVGSLPDWPAEEIAKAGRILWKRTPDG